MIVVEKKMEEKVTLVFIRNMESRVGFSRNEDTFDRHFGAPCILWFPSWVTLSSKRKGNTFKLFCDDFVTIYIYICKYIFTRYMWSKIQIQNNVYLVVENWSIVGKRYSFETLLREIHLRPDVGEWTRTLCKKLER